MTNRSRNVVEQELAEARGNLSRLQASGSSGDAGAAAELQTALQRVVALQRELDALGG